ncbi:hypothetical protein BpHYR1_042960 [Brachionus plicatilis]|uniref:Uncharacterized protein n=1 Tax=Brachionus plicatilis TaxID=10195 RepID=A0A3M7SRT0_BRAPC|nr:hypothetical protein BpHYR1_042960 [Brachionus plicatilis]
MDSKGISVKSFDGHTDSKEFKRLFDLNAVLLNWSDEKKLTVLPLLLTAKAKRLNDGLTDAQKTTSELIVTELVNGCSQSAEALHQDFLDRKPLFDETVVDFAKSLQALLEKALPALDTAQKKQGKE